MNNKFKDGDKVIPINKTTIGFEGLKDSIVWKRAQNKNQPFLYIKCSYPERQFYVCVDELGTAGDYFYESDLIPYVEQEEKEMNNKIQITEEQAEALESFKNFVYGGGYIEHFVTVRDNWVDKYKPLKDFTVDEFARLMYEPNGFEVIEDEPKHVYKVGDYVFFPEDTVYKLIKELEPYKGIQRFKDETIENGKKAQGSLTVNNVRPATQEEINSYKEAEYWASFGREVAEFKAGDGFIDSNGRSFQIGEFISIEKAKDWYEDKDFLGLFPSEHYKKYE